MYENISLIKQVHELISVEKSEMIADEYLKKIELSLIGLLRKSQCSSLEIFYTMFIRALMTDKRTIIIQSPLSLIKNLRDVEIVIQNIILLNSENKNILILDTITNETRYKGCSCRIIK